MRPIFNENKATQAAGRLLEQSGMRMNSMKLIKLLYLADREALLRWGEPVTSDGYVFMKHGPVLIHVHNLVADGDDPRRAPSAWSSAIAQPRAHELELRGPVEYRHLSGPELALLDEIVALHGAKTPWELMDWTHGLPEWRDPHGSAIPFGVRDILAANGCTEKHIATVEAELEGVSLIFGW